MKTVKIALLLAWFFGFRFPLDGDTAARVQALVGPFKSKAACEAGFDSAQDTLDVPKIVFTGCVEVKNA